VADEDRWILVGSEAEFAEAKGVAVMVGERRVAVFRVQGRWYAMQDACPHMGASLADGRIEDGHVVCHWHDWTYSLETGANASERRGCARTYPVRVSDGGVFVRRPDQPERKPWDPPPEEEQDDWVRWDPDRFFKKKEQED